MKQKKTFNKKILKNKYRNDAKIYMETIGMDYYDYSLSNSTMIKNLTYSRSKNKPVDIKDYHYTIDFRQYRLGDSKSISKFNDNHISGEITYIKPKNSIQIKIDKDFTRIDLNPMIKNLLRNYGLEKHYFKNVNEMILLIESPHYRFKIIFEELTLIMNKKQTEVKSAVGKLLIQSK